MQGFLFFFGNLDWPNTSGTAYIVNKLTSAFMVWAYGASLIAVYFMALARVNTISDRFKEMVSLLYLLKKDAVLEMIAFVELHRCTFKIFYVEITWSQTVALLMAAVSPVMSYAFSYLIQ